MELTGTLTDIAVDGDEEHGALVYVRLDPGQRIPPEEGTPVVLSLPVRRCSHGTLITYKDDGSQTWRFCCDYDPW